MKPDVIACSFAEFLHQELAQSSAEPYEDMIKQARQKLGPLEPTSHVVYVPSVLLGGTEDIGNVQKMNARATMICNGDIAVQLDEGPPGGSIKGIQLYEDEMHRMRLRLVWG